MKNPNVDYITDVYFGDDIDTSEPLLSYEEYGLLDNVDWHCIWEQLVAEWMVKQ